MNYINKDEMISHLEERREMNGELSFTYTDIIRMLRKRPSANVRENVRGEWFFDAEVGKWICPFCRYEVSVNWKIPKARFCASCGADMRD